MPQSLQPSWLCFQLVRREIFFSAEQTKSHFVLVKTFSYFFSFSPTMRPLQTSLVYLLMCSYGHSLCPYCLSSNSFEASQPSQLFHCCYSFKRERIS